MKSGIPRIASLHRIFEWQEALLDPLKLIPQELQKNYPNSILVEKQSAFKFHLENNLGNQVPALPMRNNLGIFQP